MTIDVSPIPNFIPSGFKTINVIFVVKDADKVMAFYNRAFNAEELLRLTTEEGMVFHAEMKINDTIIMLTESGYSEKEQESSIIIQLYVGDVEGIVEGAISAGCMLLAPIENQFNGDRAARLKDPFGHQWIIATHMEDVTVREMQKRFHEALQ